MGAKTLEKPMENQQFYKPGVNKGTGSALKGILRGYVRDTVINNDEVWAQAKRKKASARERWEQAT